MSEILPVITTIMGTVMALGYFPQAYKILKKKSASDVSIETYIIFALGTLTWLVYGLSLDAAPLIISNAIGIIGSVSVIISCYIYRKS